MCCGDSGCGGLIDDGEYGGVREDLEGEKGKWSEVEMKTSVAEVSRRQSTWWRMEVEVVRGREEEMKTAGERSESAVLLHGEWKTRQMTQGRPVGQLNCDGARYDNR